jgi:hypothetical protein
MNFINKKEIILIFDLLNDERLEYILLRNINNELPSRLTRGKDIDILVHKKDEAKFVDFFRSNEYKTLRHPYRNQVFLYGMDKFKFKFKNNKNNILFDLNYQLAVNSLDAGQLFPLDNAIQISSWANKRFVKKEGDFSYWTLSYEDEFVSLVARSIFDKREFDKGYIKRISELLLMIDKEKVLLKLNLIFFKFADNLLKLIEDSDYSNVTKRYFEFRDY